MTIIDTLNSVSASITTNTDTLRNLLTEIQSGTIIADTGDAPIYDEATGVWTCAQSTANANGEYLGIYKLPLATICSILNSLNIIAFTPPAAPNTPARILPCGADPLTGWQNLPALVDLEGQEFNQFSIRSATPFEVRLRLAQEWCYTFDFTVSNGGWTADYGTYSSGGWQGTAYGTGGGISGLQKSFSDADLRSVSVVHSASGYGGASQKLLRLQHDSDPYVDHSLGALNNGTDLVTTWQTTTPNSVDNIKLFWDGAGSNSVTIKRVTITGAGTNPFGAGNCN